MYDYPTSNPISHWSQTYLNKYEAFIEKFNHVLYTPTPSMR